jgi:hypothetical protein
MMAFGAGAAQAETGAAWLLAEKEPNSGLIALLDAEVGLEKETTGILHSKILGIAVLFECEGIATVNAKLLPNGSIGEKTGTVSGSKIKFSGCITKLNGATSAVCEPNAGGTEKGVINTTAGHGLIVLHETVAKVKTELTQILPDVGETFATIEMSKECAIGSKVPVIGKAFLEDCEGKFLTHLVKHLVQVGPLTELWTISKTAEHVATILGSSWAKLLGTHAGFKFSGDPA